MERNKHIFYVPYAFFFKPAFEMKDKEWIGIFKLCLHFFISVFAVMAMYAPCMDTGEGKLNKSGFQVI
jgi:hypothetical protein